MDRRNFLNVMALSPLALASGAFVMDVTKIKDIKWAMGWILWREYNQKQIPLAEAVKDLKELGLQGIEFTPRPDELSKQGFTRESFRDLLKDNQLEVSGHYFSAPFFDRAKDQETTKAFQEKLDSLKFFGAKNIIIGPPGTKTAENTDAPIEKSAVIINQLGKTAADQGFEIGIHPHVGTIVETPEQTKQILDLTDPKFVKFSPDTGHIQLGGGDVLATLETYKTRINYFHFKDVAGKLERPFGNNLRELGNGEIDFPAIMKLLDKISYKGWINVEQDKTKLTPRESAGLSARYIKDKLR